MCILFDKDIALPAAEEELERVQSWVEAFLEELGCNSKTVLEIGVAVEEIFINIAKYAYNGMGGETTVRAGVDGPFVILRFEDTGAAFNPLEAPPPNVQANAEERPIGGLGIFMVIKMMDKVEYERKEEKNLLTIRKKIKA
jgi:anti-sigma regulatory factor (Ser/Thr protein kinase)